MNFPRRGEKPKKKKNTWLKPWFKSRLKPLGLNRANPDKLYKYFVCRDTQKIRIHYGLCLEIAGSVFFPLYSTFLFITLFSELCDRFKIKNNTQGFSTVIEWITFHSIYLLEVAFQWILQNWKCLWLQFVFQIVYFQ